MGDIVARVKKARTRQSRQIRQTTLVLGVCLVVYCLFFVWITPTAHGNDHYTDNDVVSSSPNPSRPEYFLRYTSSDTTLNNLSLTEEQCNAVFPGLTKDIDDVVAQGPFIVKQMGDFGPLQGRIKDGKIYIIHAQRKADLSKEMVNSRTAALHQLHRALLTAPAPLPDTIFSLNFQDQPFGTAFTYSRAADPALRSKAPDARSFLMPHFSFWAWNLPFVGSMWRAADAIAALESANYNTPEKWQSGKIAKAVWRGTAWFNSVNSPQLRQKLLATARGKPWADVQALDWATGGGGSNKNASNALKIEDFCRYKYVVHTEGITYSGRFQFLQMCASVVLTPPIQWMQHTTHLIKPLFSSSLDLTSLSSSSTRDKRSLNNDEDDPRPQSQSLEAKTSSPHAKRAAGGKSGSHSRPVLASSSSSSSSSSSPSGPGKPNRPWTPSERVRKAWPVQYAPSQANIVFVAPDWSDLEDTVAWLEAHPQVAEGIARRQRELFVGGGYFSPAAETCYWRALLCGWASMARPEGGDWVDGKDGELGVPFETFSLSNGD